jgi:hypothetical protein
VALKKWQTRYTGVRIISITLFLLSAIVGIGARFFELGAAPLATDEFYLTSSVEQILKYGVPRFECGGYYVRGIVFQYLVAPILWAGISAEASARLIAGIFNLAAIPAVYLLARRAAGPAAAVICAVLFLLSLWEIEFSRFGRMYAPYQALFLWYVFFLLRSTLDGDFRARYATFILSVVAPLIWEGGALLAILNFATPLFSRARFRLIDAFICVSILAAVLVFRSLDFRHLGGLSPLPPDMVPTTGTESILGMLMTNWVLSEFIRSVMWWLPGILMVAVVTGLGFKYRKHLPADLVWRITLTAVAAGFIAGVFGAALGLLVLGLLAFADKGHDIRQVARWLTPILVTTGLFWAAFIIQSDSTEPGITSVINSLLVRLLKYPNIFDSVLYQWLETMPLLTVSFGALVLLAAFLVIVFGDMRELIVLRFLIFISVALILLIGVIPTIYNETRYTFFLFPMIYIIAAGGVLTAIRQFLPNLSPHIANFSGAALLALLFAATEDFNPGHILQISSPTAIYRQDMADSMQNHLYFRTDFRSVGQYLSTNRAPGDIVVTADVASTYYIDAADAVYIAESSKLFSPTLRYRLAGCARTLHFVQNW